jgi:hypothetical protein
LSGVTGVQSPRSASVFGEGIVVEDLLIKYTKFARIVRGLAVLSGVLFVIGITLLQTLAARAGNMAQVPTGSIPTVTGTEMAAYAVVLRNEQGQAYVRAGPDINYYEIIGVVYPDQRLPVLGLSPAGQWVKIAYPGVPSGEGWIYFTLVTVEGNPPTVDLPPTPTPPVTATIDPTLAAQFLVDLPPTRLPTYTPAAPLSIPTFQPDLVEATAGRLPVGFIVVGMFVLGAFGILISLLRGH